ncbi:UvrD/REP helicase [Mycolicibacterium mageritense DSM 44476 = CIP 104973]|uniref:DNA helicase n=2 Tax=Mycolicibacterium TaxID=1866885 RepID=A0ABN5YHI2_MYCME|nr:MULTISPECIES: ATP-binding domain-containing protein [Mycolicibacterium]MCC9185449.1 AAA family ATPase [Mycolicibacterium mageritense]MCV7210792.1 AAA family ATPase [Mycolicibacterium canariasense]ORV18631.1 hypothetical protein AWB94_33490 [Mycolicibacterium canariasense]BBX37552.1 DNA helicase [Mycolicibacterium mageritense]
MSVTMSPSTEQQAIIAAFLAGADLAVQAGAGTGKSTTLAFIAAAAQMYRPTTTAWYITFNKRNAEEVGATFADFGLTNARASTAHALAYRGCRTNPALTHMVDHLNRDSMPIRAEMKHLGIAKASRCLRATVEFNPNTNAYTRIEIPNYSLPFGAQRRFLTLTRDTVKLFCQSASPTMTEDHVPYLGELEPALRPLVRAALLESAQALWAELTSPHGQLKTSHDHYLKAWALTSPQIGSDGDVVLYDEAQDANGVMAGLVLAQRGRVQLVLCGDPFQELYSFTGSIDAMQGFSAQQGVVTLPLRESRRFGPEIAAHANGILELLDPGHEVPMRLLGVGPADGHLRDVFDEHEAFGCDAVVCATNRQVVDAIVSHTRAGRRVYSTLDLQDLVSLARDVALVESGRADECAEPVLRRFTDLVSWREWLRSVPGVEEESLHATVTLVRTHGAEALEQLARTVVASRDMADVTVSTIHKAKGGTWERVHVLMGEVDIEDTAKLRMLYVAMTRARTLVLREVSFVSSEDAGQTKPAA